MYLHSCKIPESTLLVIYWKERGKKIEMKSLFLTRRPYVLIFFNTIKEKEANTPELLLKRTPCLHQVSVVRIIKL
jgi:hypothetical protein